jgi:hypothetical protein
MPQTYKTHAHRPRLSVWAFLFTLVALVLLVADRFAGVTLAGFTGSQLALLSTIVATFLLVGISRLYIVKLQDRIIRLEMRLRLREVLPAAQQGAIARLSTSQLVGLRFASDAELPALVERTLREGLSRDEIKRAIVTWEPDYERT